MKRLRLLPVFLGLVLFAAGARGLFAQGGATGALDGTVLDSSGGVVAGADVQIADERTGNLTRTLRTSSNGTFAATLLPPSVYVVTVNAKGFGENKTTEIDVRVTETTTIYITLKPSQLSQEVTVSAQVVDVDTENATTGQDITTNTVRSLPLATQNFQQLLTLSTGAESSLNNAGQLGRGDVRIQVNGQREDNNNYLIEGVTATDYNVAELTNTPLPSPDVIQEFKVQTSLYDATQGRNGGGNINAILKSGTNQFHFDAYEFFRNDALDANTFFQNAAGVSRGDLKQNIFGGSGGGPLGSDGKFGYFFGNYQGSRQRSGIDNGTFISTTFPILPATRDQASLSQAFFGNTTTPIDPVVLALLNFQSNQFGGAGGGFLIPTLAGTPGYVLQPNGPPIINSAPFVYSSAGRFSDNQFTTNWDRNFNTEKDKVAVRFFFSDSSALKPFGAGGLTASLGGSVNATDLNFPFETPINSRFLSATETHVVSPGFVNEFRFGFVRINNSDLNVPIVTAGDLGINRPTSNLTDDIYKFTFFSSGYQIGPTPQANQYQAQNNFDLVDTVSTIHGPHQVRFGVEVNRVLLNKLFPQVFNGQVYFADGPSPLASLNSAFPNGLTDFQSFLLGAPAFSFGGGGVYNHEYRIANYGLFIQDDYKVRSDLTVNVGLRVEVNGAFHDLLDHIGNVDPNLLLQGQYPFIYPAGVDQFGIPGFTGTASGTTLGNNYSTGLGPRVGFAYDLFDKHTTTIRGGYGIYYVREDVGAVDQLSFQSPLLPIAFAGGAPGSLANFFVIGNGNPNGLPPAGVIDPAFIPVISQLTGFTNGQTSQAPIYNNNSINLFGLQVPQHFIVPNTQQWNLTAQRSLPGKWVLEVGYVGSHSIHLRETRDSIQSVLATPADPITVTGAGGQPFTITTTTVANGPARSIYQGLNGYSGFELFANDAYSHYNSLQTTLSRNWGGGYFQAAYTFARSTDSTSTGNTAFNTAWDNQADINDSRGLSDFDRTHRLVASYVYTLPFAKGATGWKGIALRDWGVSGVAIFQSGLPFSIIDSAAGTAYDGETTITAGASIAQGGSLSQAYTSGSLATKLTHYVNSADFQPAPIIGDDGIATGFGNLGRNILRGPFQQNWDFSIIKYFHITERQDLRFTTDFFNIWNHPVFGNPSFTDIENPATFGEIQTQVNNPRVMQFSLRYAF
jgi:Carboxypeptidase regulatory-like domain